VRALLALGWGILAAAPLAAEAVRVAVAARARALRPEAEGSGPPPEGRAPALFAGVHRGVPRRRRCRREEAALQREAPLAADLLAVAGAAGLTPFLALGVAATAAPPRAAARFRAILDGVATGEGRLAAVLAREAALSPPLAPILEVLVASEQLGAPAAVALSRLAADGRSRVRRAALARARTVPVRLLFPLVFLVLPAFLLLTVAPVLLVGARP